MRLSTIAGLIVVLGLSAGLTVGGAFLLRKRLPNGGRPRPVEDERIDSAFARQLEHAAHIGLTEAREGDDGRAEVAEGPWTHRVELAAGECGAIVFGAAGCLLVSGAELRDAEGQLIDRVGHAYEPRVDQMQWCAWDSAETLLLEARLRADRDCAREHQGRGAVRWEVRRGPAEDVSGPSGLISLHDTSSSIRRDGQEAAARGWLDAHPGEGEALGTARETRYSDGALLRPASAATCHAMYALVNAGLASPVHPNLDLGDAPASRCPPEGAGATSPIAPVRRSAGGSWDRILAVVDRGALGAPCVEVTVALLRQGVPVEPVRVRDLATGDERALSAEEGAPFVFRDRSCPASGLVAYLVPATDGRTYRVDARSVPAAEGAVAQPAPEPNGPFPTERAVSDAARGKARRCERRRDRAACLELAHDYRQARGVPQDLARAADLFERACDLGSAEGCAYLAHAYGEGEGVTENDAEAERRYRAACEQGSGVACAYVGDIERRTAGAPADAMERARDHYARACRAGVQSACTNRDLLTDLNLL